MVSSVVPPRSLRLCGKSPSDLFLDTGLRLAFLGVALGVLGGCALASSGDPEERTRPEEPDAFIRYVEEDFQEHAWQSLLSSSDPNLFNQRVVQGGISEPQYLAELFGLTRQGNAIQDGPTLDFADFDRIEFVTFGSMGDSAPPYRYAGQAILSNGETRLLNTRVDQIRGRFVLSIPRD